MDSLGDFAAIHQHNHDDHEGHDHSDTTMAPGVTMAMPKDADDGDAAAEPGSSASSTEDMADHGMGHMDHMMSPYLFSDAKGYYVLFRQAFVNSTGGFIGALIGTFAFGLITTIGFELGKRVEQSARLARANGEKSAFPKILFGSVAHAVRLLLHYIAMLLVMTFNIWIILAVLVGHGVGFIIVTFLFKDTALSKAERKDETCGC